MQPSATRAVAEKAKDLKDQGLPVVSLSSGVPGFRAPEVSQRYAERAMTEGKTFYTATAGTVELKRAVSDYYHDRFGLQYETDQVIVGTGAKPLIFEALGAIIDPGDEVILTAPAWVSYVEQIRFFGGKPVIVETIERTFKIDIDRVRAATSNKTVAIIINSPNNPTGLIYDQKTMKDLCSLAIEKDIYIINDEIYERIIFDGCDYRNPLCFTPEAKEHILNINGVSKTYSMTGWRIGYALGSKELVRKITALQGHLTSGACSIAQWAALGAIREADSEVDKMVSIYQNRRTIIAAELTQFPFISYIEPQGAFYFFVDIRKTIGTSSRGKIITDDITFAEVLLEQEYVTVIPGTAFLLPGYVRISFTKGEDEIRAGLKRLGKFLTALS